MSALSNFYDGTVKGYDTGEKTPGLMNNWEFNVWAENNPTEAAKLGSAGYTANSNNMEGPQYSGSMSGNSPASGGLASIGGGLSTLTGLGNLALGYKNYGLTKDIVSHNIMDSNRAHDASKTQYNNSLARTAAIDKHYGTTSAGTKVGG